jgi:Phage tail protein E.
MSKADKEQQAKAEADLSQPLQNDGRKVTIKLDVPIQRGENSINSITVFKPNAGNLRGCNMNNILTLDVQTLQRILPRVTEPVLHPDDFDTIDLSDLMNLGLAVASFFAPPQDRKQAHAEMAAKK